MIGWCEEEDRFKTNKKEAIRIGNCGEITFWVEGRLFNFRAL